MTTTSRSRALLPAALVIVALILIGAVVVWVATRDDDDPAADVTQTQTQEATSGEGEDSAAAPSSGEEVESATGGDPAAGCESQLCITTATEVTDTLTGADGTVWTLQQPWAEADPVDGVDGGGAATYVSAAGEVTLTVRGAGDLEGARAYADTLLADLGEPQLESPVWDTPQEGRGTGVVYGFDGETTTYLWYDDEGVVCVLEGPGEGEATFDFYAALPSI